MAIPRPSRTISEPDSQPVKTPTKPFTDNDFRPSDVFKFEPLPDITVQELAYLLMVLYEPAIHFKSYLKLPQDLKRHFKQTKI